MGPANPRDCAAPEVTKRCVLDRELIEGDREEQIRCFSSNRCLINKTAEPAAHGDSVEESERIQLGR